jgi:hypothetical protein
MIKAFEEFSLGAFPLFIRVSVKSGKKSKIPGIFAGD